VDELHLEAQLVAGHDRPAELHLVEAHHPDLDPARIGAVVSSQIPAAWARDSRIRTPGMTGWDGKWPAKKSSVR